MSAEDLACFPGDKGHLSLETENEGRGDEIQESWKKSFLFVILWLSPLLKNNCQNPTSLTLLGL